MGENFECLTIGVGRIYKSIQRLKKMRMNDLGLKGTHVMCLYYLGICTDGLTAAELCEKCREDKAGISRILKELEKDGYIQYKESAAGKRYRARAVLTAAGQKIAEQMNALILHAVCEGGKGLTDDDRKTFYRVLFRIADNLENACAQLMACE